MSTWLGHSKQSQTCAMANAAVIPRRAGWSNGCCPILDRLSIDDPGNVFYTPSRSPATALGDLSSPVHAKLLPAVKTLRDFLQHEYLPRARLGLSLSELPLGTQWYAYRIKRSVGRRALGGSDPPSRHRRSRAAWKQFELAPAAGTV